jgi:hypothetical protein
MNDFFQARSRSCWIIGWTIDHRFGRSLLSGRPICTLELVLPDQRFSINIEAGLTSLFGRL